LAYAVITAMGPTYSWFHLYELQFTGQSFAMTQKEVPKEITKMAKGALKTATISVHFAQ
jgi:pyrroline-5-carboxylate reductase